MKFYYYLFYKVFLFFEKREKSIVYPKELAATGILSLIEMVNFFVVIMVLNISSKNIKVLLVGIFMLLPWFVNNYLFLKKEKYEKIVNRFKNESELQKTIGGIIVWAYVILTFFSLFYFVDPV